MMGLTAAPAHAWYYSATGQWASFNFGNWTVYQDEWGSTAPCTLYANYAGNFASAGTWTGTGTKGYPHTQANIDLDLRGGHDVQAGFNTSSPAVQNSNDRWIWFYDCWTANMQDEIMIYECAPYYSQRIGGYGTRIATNVYAGWTTWKEVWQVQGSWNILMFYRGDGGRASGSDDVYEILQWCYNNGKLHNSTFHQISWGVEPTQGSGQWTENNFWCNYH